MQEYGNDRQNDKVIMANSDWIPERFQERVEDWADLSRRHAGAQALVAIGRHVFEPEAWDRQPLGAVLVLPDANLSGLRRLAAEGDRLGRRWIAAPLIMTPGFIRESLDTFPLELLEIHQQHRAVFGADPFLNLTFQPEHIRLQCERECKVMLTRIRQGILTAAGHEEFLAELANGIAEQLVRTLRGMLWLRGHSALGPLPEVLQRSHAHIGQPMPWLAPALAGELDSGWTAIETMYADIGSLAGLVDEAASNADSHLAEGSQSR